MAKETSEQYAERMLGTVGNLLNKFGRLLESDQFSSYKERFESLSTDHAYGMVNVESAMLLRNEVTKNVTLAQIDQIRGLVERKIAFWNERFSEPFASTEAAQAAKDWLNGAGNGDPVTVRKWIAAGWDILKRLLNAPWGCCSCCGRPLFPRKIGETWRTFKDCPTCHWAKVDAQSTLQDATRGVTSAERKQRSRHAEARAERKNGPIGGRGKGKKSSKK